MIAVLLSEAICSASCSKTYRDIDVKDVKLENVSLSSLRSIDAVLLVEIDNPAGPKFKAENIKGVVYQKGEQIATFSSDDIVTLEPKSITESKITVRLTLDNPFGFLGGVAKDRGVNFGDFTIDIQADVTSGLLTVNYKKKGLEVKSMIKKSPFSSKDTTSL